MKEKSFERKDEVLQAALDEFILKSYDHASLNMIIQNSKISKGTFYYHFKNKEDLYLHLLKESVQLKWDFISKMTENNQLDFAQMDLFDKFVYQAEIGIYFSKEYPKYDQLAKQFGKEVGQPIYEKALKALNQDGTNVLKPMIEAAILNGELNEEYGVEFIVNTLTHLFNTFEEIAGKDKSAEETIENFKKLVKFIKYGLKK